jgi:uncharacterized membrane protein YgdD (TMEM256/DUF423 family)
LNRSFLISGSVLAVLAVMLGAFGAHALKEILEHVQLQVFETGVRYQMYHSLALILTGLLAEKFPSRYTRYAGNLFLTGIIFFSGSVYLLAMKNVLGIESWIFLGPVTPIGGLCLIAGWVLFLLSVLKNNSQ